MGSCLIPQKWLLNELILQLLPRVLSGWWLEWPRPNNLRSLTGKRCFGPMDLCLLSNQQLERNTNTCNLQPDKKGSKTLNIQNILQFKYRKLQKCLELELSK